LKKLLALGLAVGCASCAKFPDNATGSQFTRIIFRLEVAGKINTSIDDDPSTFYLYDFAIRASTDPNPQDQTAPRPVLGANEPNGRMAGSPTHFVEFNGQFATVANPFVLYRFAKTSEVENPTDPTNDIELSSFAESTRRRIVNFDRVENGTRVLQFELFTDQLADTDEAAQALQSLQVNFLSMTRPANIGSGTRVIDAFGDTRSPQINDYFLIDLRANRVYSGTLSPGFEPENDTIPGTLPDVDIVNWSIEVQRP